MIYAWCNSVTVSMALINSDQLTDILKVSLDVDLAKNEEF